MTTTDNNLITHEFRAAENLPDLLTVKELATYLQVSVHTIYYWRGRLGVCQLRSRTSVEVHGPST